MNGTAKYTVLELNGSNAIVIEDLAEFQRINENERIAIATATINLTIAALCFILASRRLYELRQAATSSKVVTYTRIVFIAIAVSQFVHTLQLTLARKFPWICGTVAHLSATAYGFIHLLFYLVLHERKKATESLVRKKLRKLYRLGSRIAIILVGLGALLVIGAPFIMVNGVLVISARNDETVPPICVLQMDSKLLALFGGLDFGLNMIYLSLFFVPLFHGASDVASRSTAPMTQETIVSLHHLAKRNLFVSSLQAMVTVTVFSWISHAASHINRNLRYYHLGITVLPSIDVDATFIAMVFLTQAWLPNRLKKKLIKLSRVAPTIKNFPESSVGGLSEC